MTVARYIGYLLYIQLDPSIWPSSYYLFLSSYKQQQQKLWRPIDGSVHLCIFKFGDLGVINFTWTYFNLIKYTYFKQEYCRRFWYRTMCLQAHKILLRSGVMSTLLFLCLACNSLKPWFILLSFLKAQLVQCVFCPDDQMLWFYCSEKEHTKLQSKWIKKNSCSIFPIYLQSLRHLILYKDSFVKVLAKELPDICIWSKHWQLSAPYNTLCDFDRTINTNQHKSKFSWFLCVLKQVITKSL